ncbi:MAG: hypothetical protein HWE12_04910 [Oceanospirillaceae bacterium]|nr:hypothetical protein [Oceanospirillaceae bacterium]
MLNPKAVELIKLYNVRSKHSNYQALPSCLTNVLSEGDLDIKSRSEWKRLEYILQEIKIDGKSIIDIGGNSGFFSFEFLDRGAKSVCLYEGNKEHADFAKRAAEYLSFKKLVIVNEYFDFDRPRELKFDICLLLNVLHHVGDDYGNQRLSIERARQTISDTVRKLVDLSDVMVFQLGFNWKGDPSLPLFEKGKKQEIIEFIEQAIVGSGWEIKSIGIYDKVKETYTTPNQQNLARFDELGEFLNRPIFVLESKKPSGRK